MDKSRPPEGAKQQLPMLLPCHFGKAENRITKPRLVQNEDCKHEQEH